MIIWSNNALQRFTFIIFKKFCNETYDCFRRFLQFLQLPHYYFLPNLEIIRNIFNSSNFRMPSAFWRIRFLVNILQIEGLHQNHLNIYSMHLTLSRRRPLSYRNQSIDLRSKSTDWFLYDNGLRLERVNRLTLFLLRSTSGANLILNLWGVALIKRGAYFKVRVIIHMKFQNF